MRNKIISMRQEIYANRSPINLLVIGQRGVGKSAFINTMNAAITNKRSYVSPLSVPGPRSNMYRKIRVGGDDWNRMGNISLFDIPGFDFKTYKERILLRKILLGTRLEQELTLPLMEGNLIRRDQANLIHFCLWVVDAEKLEGDRRTRWFRSSAQASGSDLDYMEETIKDMRTLVPTQPSWIPTSSSPKWIKLA